MNNTKYTKILILTIVILIFCSILFSTQNIEYTNKENRIATKDNDAILKNSNIYYSIEINDLPGSPNNWEYIKNLGICTGNGSINNPYIIQNKTFIANFMYHSLVIENSIVHFKIINCTFKDANYNLRCGIYMDNVTNGFLFNNTMTNNEYGLRLWGGCGRNIISNNTIYNNELNGISVVQSNNSLIFDNKLYNNNDGINLNNCYNNTIFNNTSNDNDWAGIQLLYCINNTVLNNTIYNNDRGVYLNTVSNNNTVKNNIITNHAYGIKIWKNCSENTILNNIINEWSYGVVISDDCHYNIIKNNTINHMYGGICLGNECHNNTIISNKIFNTTDGIHLSFECNNNTISNNTVHYSVIDYGYGIDLSFNCDNNTIFNNTITSNKYGILIASDCNYNNISSNLIFNNSIYGTFLASGCGQNLLYKNFFINNTIHAEDNGFKNFWNNSLIGNYWDNYSGEDLLLPFNIGDTPYNITGSAQNKDYLPIVFNYDRSQPPGSLTLSSNADPIVNNGSFVLSWDAATNADNYSVYVSNSYITIIDLSCTELESGIEILYHSITDLLTGDYYYIVIAYNEYGNTTSNCIVVIVERIPLTFELTTDAGSLVGDGLYYLNWTTSEFANNYSIYMNDTMITEFNESLILIEQGLTNNSYLINTTTNGYRYYIIVAYNDYGNTTSNCIVVFVGRIPLIFELTTDADILDRDGIYYLNWTTSEFASNYSIYMSNKTITEFSEELILIAQGLTNNSYLINTTTNGYYYYIVIAYNEYGNETSICIEILVDNSNIFPSDNEDDDDSKNKDNEIQNEEEVRNIIVASIIVGSIGVVATIASVHIFSGTKGSSMLSQKLRKNQLRKVERIKVKRKRKKKISIKEEISSKYSEEILVELINKKELLELFNESTNLEEIPTSLTNKILTIVSKDFLFQVDQIGFTDSFKREFLKEMLSFSPKERALIVEDILKNTIIYPIPPFKREKDDKKTVEEVLVYEDYVLELIQEYLMDKRQFKPNKIINYLSSRFAKASINININGIKRILKSLVEKNMIVEGSTLIKEKVLLNENRKEIYDKIIELPGIFFNELVRNVELSNAVVRWHINILLKFGFIRSEKIENYEVYYDVNVETEDDKILHIISREKYMNVISFLEENDYGITKTQLSNELGMHISTITKYLSKLDEFGLLDIKKSSNKTLYLLNQKQYNKFKDKIVL